MKFTNLCNKDYLRVLKIEKNKFIGKIFVVCIFLLFILFFVGFMSYYITYNFYLSSIRENILLILITLFFPVAIFLILFLYLKEKGLKYELLKDKDILGAKKILVNKRIYRKTTRTNEGFKDKTFYTFIFSIDGQLYDFYVSKKVYKKKKIGDLILIVEYNLYETVNLSRFELY